MADTRRVFADLAAKYKESSQHFKTKLNHLGKNITLKQYLQCVHEDQISDLKLQDQALLIFKGRPRVKMNEVLYAKALSDTPIEYTMQLAKTYHGFTEEIDKCKYYIIY